MSGRVCWLCSSDSWLQFASSSRKLPHSLNGPFKSKLPLRKLPRILVHQESSRIFSCDGHPITTDAHSSFSTNGFLIS